MKRLLPRRRELLAFAVLALVCAIIVSRCQVAEHDLWLGVLSMPLFIFAALMGLRRSPAWQVVAAPAPERDAPE